MSLYAYIASYVQVKILRAPQIADFLSADSLVGCRILNKYEDIYECIHYNDLNDYYDKEYGAPRAHFIRLFSLPMHSIF